MSTINYVSIFCVILMLSFLITSIFIAFRKNKINLKEALLKIDIEWGKVCKKCKMELPEHSLVECHVDELLKFNGITCKYCKKENCGRNLITEKKLDLYKKNDE